MFTDYVAEQSCTSGRNAFFTGMYPLRTGMIPPQLPGSPSYLRPGTPALAKFLLDLGYNTGEFGKNHLGDHTDALPTAHGFQEYWGYLYHLDAMQQVSFPDINKTPTAADGRPAVQEHADPRHSGGTRRRRSEDDDLPDAAAPRPVVQVSDGTARNQTCSDEGPLTLDRSKTVDEEISAKVIDFLDRNDPKKTNKPFFVWYNPARMHVMTVLSPKYEAMVGERGGKDWGVNEAGMKQMDDNIGHRAQEARGHGPARQHDRRVHDRQRRRGHHLPGRRRHPVQGPERLRPGKAATAHRWSSAGRASSSQARSRTTLRRARLAAHVRRHRRRRQGRRAEEADRGRPISRHRQDHARRRQPARIPRRQVGKVGARLLLLLLGHGRRRRSATRTGRCTTRCRSPGRPAGSCR